jgi:hypothetical protein
LSGIGKKEEEEEEEEEEVVGEMVSTKILARVVK